MRCANNIGWDRRDGFTFIEILAALMFLAILVPAIVGGLTLSNRISVLAERKVIAAELAENKLNEQLVGNSWLAGSSTSGDFGQDHPGFRWELTQESWQGDTMNQMTQLSMEVFFPVQGREHSVKLTTLANPNAQSAASATPSPSATPATK